MQHLPDVKAREFLSDTAIVYGVGTASEPAKLRFTSVPKSLCWIDCEFLALNPECHE